MAGSWLIPLDHPQTFETFKRGLDEIAVNLRDIYQIIITHFHLDHSGLAAKLKKLSGAELTLHQKEDVDATEGGTR